MSKEKECSCSKCVCIDLEEHKKNRQNDICKCECQDEAIELDTIIVTGNRKSSSSDFINNIIPDINTDDYLNNIISSDEYWYNNVWFQINQLPKNTQKLIDKIGRKKVVRTLFNPNKIEIVVVANGKNKTSTFGHIAIFIDNVEFGMSPKGWDVRTKEKFLNDYNVNLHRAAISYEINMSFTQKQMLVHVLLESMKTAGPYQLTTNDCTMATIHMFSFMGINIADPRYNKGFYTPSDVNLYLKNTTQSGKSHFYPAK